MLILKKLLFAHNQQFFKLFAFFLFSMMPWCKILYLLHYFQFSLSLQSIISNIFYFNKHFCFCYCLLTNIPVKPCLTYTVRKKSGRTDISINIQWSGRLTVQLTPSMNINWSCNFFQYIFSNSVYLYPFRRTLRVWALSTKQNLPTSASFLSSHDQKKQR